MSEPKPLITANQREALDMLIAAGGSGFVWDLLWGMPCKKDKNRLNKVFQDSLNRKGLIRTEMRPWGGGARKLLWAELVHPTAYYADLVIVTAGEISGAKTNSGGRPFGSGETIRKGVWPDVDYSGENLNIRESSGGYVPARSSADFIMRGANS